MRILTNGAVLICGLGCASPTLDTRNTTTTTLEYEAPVVDPVRSECTTTAGGASVTVESIDGGPKTVSVRPGPVELNGILCTNGRSLSAGTGQQ